MDICLEHQPSPPQWVIRERLIDRRCRVVHQDVDRPAKLLDRQRHNGVALLLVRQICDNYLDFVSVLGNSSRSLFETARQGCVCTERPGHESDVSAFRCKPLCDARTDSAAGTGDKRSASFEAIGHATSTSRRSD